MCLTFPQEERKNMHKLTLPLSTPAALAACLLAVPSLRAQNEPTAKPVTNLPPIIVQASRTGRTAEEMPAHVQVITAEEIAKSGQRTVADLLQKTAGLPLQTYSDNPTTTAVALRGFGENSHGRVLILVNGERLNNPDMAAPNLTRIPLESVKRIEIIRGPQTVLYGDYAEAGVINIITDTSVDTKPVTTVATSVGSYDTYSTHLSKSGTFEDGVTYFAGADWNKSGGYRANGDYETYDLESSITKRWDAMRSLSFSGYYHDGTYGLPGALSWKEFKANPRQTDAPNDQVDIKNWGGNVSGSTKLGEDGQLEANLTASRRETDSSFISSSYWQNTVIDSYAFTPRYLLDTDILNHENRLTLGSDLRFDQASMNYHGMYWGFPYKGARDYDRTSWAGYAQDEFFITEKLSFAVGARTERFFNRLTQAAAVDARDDQETACDAALLYRPQEDIKLFARVARYYHAPFADEATYTLPKTELVPETGYSFDVGSEISLTKEWAVSLTAYEMDTSNEIYYDPTRYANINAPADTRRQGIESALRWTRDHVGGFGIMYDYVDASFTEGVYADNNVPLVPHHTVTVNGEVYILSEVALLGNVHYVDTRYSGSDFANTATKLDDYATLDLAVRYEPHFLKGLTLLVGADNVFDNEYAYCSFYGSAYYPAAGRTWKLCASYSF